MDGRAYLAAAACAVGLGLGTVAEATAVPEAAQATRHKAKAATLELELVERPAARFARSIEAHLERVARRRRLRAATTPAGPVAGVSQSTLDAIASCESGGDPSAVNPAGYFGKYQFDLGTWESIGGSGNPADATEAEQDYRASLLYRRAGSSPWPNCGV